MEPAPEFDTITVGITTSNNYQGHRVIKSTLYKIKEYYKDKNINVQILSFGRPRVIVDDYIKKYSLEFGFIYSELSQGTLYSITKKPLNNYQKNIIFAEKVDIVLFFIESEDKIDNYIRNLIAILDKKNKPYKFK